MEPKSSTIALAAILTQFFLTLILVIGAFLVLPHFNRPYLETQERSTGVSLLYRILFGTLPMIGLLLFSDAMTPGWAPIVGSSGIPSLRFSPLISLMFCVNIAVTALAMARTGGSYGSPFSPVLLTIPGLAIILREPFEWIVIYVTASSFAFLITLPFELSLDARRIENIGLKTAYFIVSIMCFILTSVIAYITRPR